MRTAFTSILLITLLLIPGFSQPIFHQKNIFDLQDKHVHSSSIVETPDGDLLACWFYGSGERRADDVRIRGARLRKGANAWSPVFEMADTPGFPDCNPVLFIDNSDKLWLFWIAVQANRWERSILKYRTATEYSEDGPPQWSWQDIIVLKPGNEFVETIKSAFDVLITEDVVWAEYALPYNEMIVEAAADPVKRQTGWMTRTHPIILPSGRILVPLYSDGFNVSLVAISDDNGDTWRSSRPMVGLGSIQPTIARKKDGTLVAYMRDSGGPPNRAMVSQSSDDGESWTPAVDSDIPNPGSSLEVIVTRDGDWLMVYNDTEETRSSMAVALSSDEGQTWKWKKKIGMADDKSWAYPSLIQSNDGLFHLTYSYKVNRRACIQHTTFNLEWLRGER